MGIDVDVDVDIDIDIDVDVDLDVDIDIDIDTNVHSCAPSPGPIEHAGSGPWHATGDTPSSQQRKFTSQLWPRREHEMCTAVLPLLAPLSMQALCPGLPQGIPPAASKGSSHLSSGQGGSMKCAQLCSLSWPHRACRLWALACHRGYPQQPAKEVHISALAKEGAWNVHSCAPSPGPIEHAGSGPWHATGDTPSSQQRKFTSQLWPRREHEMCTAVLPLLAPLSMQALGPGMPQGIPPAASKGSSHLSSGQGGSMKCAQLCSLLGQS